MEIGRCACEGDLDAGGAPRDEGGEVAFADAEEGFVDLRTALGIFGGKEE